MVLLRAAAASLVLVLACSRTAVVNALNFGVIGTGCIGLEHIRNINLLPDSRVTAVADTSTTSLGWARDTLAELGDLDGVVFHDSYLPLLEPDAGLDALVIATPNFHHIEVLRDVAARAPEMNLLVEKPLCTTLADLAEARQLARGALRGLFWVGMEYRYIPSIGRLIREADAGTIGNLRMLAIREHRFPFLVKVRAGGACAGLSHERTPRSP
jgi:predicted dehydrogenase